MATDTTFIELAEILISLIGQDGGIKFNARMFDHNFLLKKEIKSTLTPEEYQTLKAKQIIIIGNDNEVITLEHIKTFLKKLRKVLKTKIFLHGSPLFFEGLLEINSKSYEINWGS